MTARHDARSNVEQWTRPLVLPPISRDDIVRTAIGRNPTLARRLADLCRSHAHRRANDANATGVESIQRLCREESAGLEAAARVLDLLK